MEEVALKNKQELESKAKSKAKKSHERRTSTETLLHHENEIKNKEKLPTKTMVTATATTGVKPSSMVKSNDHRKHRKHRNATNSSDGYSTTSSSSSKKSSHYATKDLRVKRPSIRQKLFRQTGIYNMPSPAKAHANATQTLVQAIINTPGPQYSAPLINKTPATLAETKRKRLQRLNALQVPTMVRMGSAP